jgi:hypothetical protein
VEYLDDKREEDWQKLDWEKVAFEYRLEHKLGVWKLMNDNS